MYVSAIGIQSTRHISTHYVTIIYLSIVIACLLRTSELLTWTAVVDIILPSFRVLHTFRANFWLNICRERLFGCSFIPLTILLIVARSTSELVVFLFFQNIDLNDFVKILIFDYRREGSCIIWWLSDLTSQYIALHSVYLWVMATDTNAVIYLFGRLLNR